MIRRIWFFIVVVNLVIGVVGYIHFEVDMIKNTNCNDDRFQFLNDQDQEEKNHFLSEKSNFKTRDEKKSMLNGCYMGN